MVDLIHAERDLTEPNDVGSQATRYSAAFAGRKDTARPFEYFDPSCDQAAHLAQLAMHVQHLGLPSPLVQAVDVLGDEDEIEAGVLRGLGEREVRGVGTHAVQ